MCYAKLRRLVGIFGFGVLQVSIDVSIQFSGLYSVEFLLKLLSRGLFYVFLCFLENFRKNSIVSMFHYFYENFDVFLCFFYHKLAGSPKTLDCITPSEKPKLSIKFLSMEHNFSFFK